MTDTVSAGDLAEYCGTVKTLAGRRCVVDQDLIARVRVVFAADLDRDMVKGEFVRNVSRKNLKRLGGGVFDER